MAITIDKNPVQEGTTLRLTCSAHSYPRVLFTWTKYGENIDGFISQKTIRKGFYVGVLYLRGITRAMGGNYTCLAQSYDGRLSVNISKVLHVHCKY
jgi:hypothetical protein